MGRVNPSGGAPTLHCAACSPRGGERFEGRKTKEKEKKIKICYFAFFVAFLWFCIVNSEEKKKKRGMVEQEDKMHQSETEKNEFV